MKTSGKIWPFILSFLFNKLASPGEHLEQSYFGQQYFHTMGVEASLLEIVPVDHSVKNYRGTESMEDKLDPSEKTNMQRVLKYKVLIPRDTRVFVHTRAVESHRG